MRVELNEFYGKPLIIEPLNAPFALDVFFAGGEGNAEGNEVPG